MIIKIIKSDRSKWYIVGEEIKAQRIYKNGNAIIVDHTLQNRRILVNYGDYEIIDSKHFKREFVTCEEIIKIEKDYANKVSYYDVSNKYDITTALAHSLLENYKRNISIGLGYKNSSYFTESEMIQGYQIPTYEELSENEKGMFNMKS
jgi:hypothetical protein